jgi:hypothetical protein
MKVALCLFFIFLTVNIVCGNRRRGGGGGGGGGRNTDREVQEAINRANEENERRMNQLREEAERNRLRALEEARIINEQAERLRIQREQEIADALADQKAFQVWQNIAQEQIKSKQIEREEILRKEAVPVNIGIFVRMISLKKSYSIFSLNSNPD